MAEFLDTLAERVHRIHRSAQRGTRAIGADRERGDTLMRRTLCIVAKAQGYGFAKVGRFEAPRKMEARAGFLRRIDQCDVETAAADRPDHLTVIAAVAQQFGMAVAMMDHAPAHHHREPHDFIGQSGQTQAMQTAFGQREIDRTPARVTGLARIGPALEYANRKPTLRKQGRQQ